jgi:hypothetical protein
VRRHWRFGRVGLGLRKNGGRKIPDRVFDLAAVADAEGLRDGSGV